MAEFDQIFPDTADEVNVTLSPAHKAVAPLAVIVGVVGAAIVVTVTGAEVAVQVPPPTVTATEVSFTSL